MRSAVPAWDRSVGRLALAVATTLAVGSPPATLLHAELSRLILGQRAQEGAVTSRGRGHHDRECERPEHTARVVGHARSVKRERFGPVLGTPSRTRISARGLDR